MVSFVRNHNYARQEESNSKYNKTDTKWQRQVFEEVAGKSDADDIFAKVANDLGGKFPGFFV